MNFEKIDAIRVRFEDGYYCDVVPSADGSGFHDFWLSKPEYGVSAYIFGIKIESAEHAATIAQANYADYVEELESVVYDDD